LRGAGAAPGVGEQRRESDTDWSRLVERTEGASPAYIKELLRRAVLLAAEDGEAGVVTGASLEAAMAELAEGGRLAERLLGARVDAQQTGPPPPPPGFPVPGAQRGPESRWSGGVQPR
jgi:hypothetical protein